MHLSRTRHPEETQFHHVVPRQVYRGKLTRLSEEQRQRTLEVRDFLNDIGLTDKETDNLGLYLPKNESSYDTNRSTHRGYGTNHQKYNADFVDEMYELMIISEKNFFSTHDTRVLVDEKLAKIRQDIRTGDIDVGPTTQSTAVSTSHNQGNVESATYSPPEGVELVQHELIGLQITPTLDMLFLGVHFCNPVTLKRIAYEIDMTMRAGFTPNLSLKPVNHRYLEVDCTCHDTIIADAFLQIDYQMKMASMQDVLYLPYHHITEQRVEEQCLIFDQLESKKITIDEAYMRLTKLGFTRIGTSLLGGEDAFPKVCDTLYEFQFKKLKEDQIAYDCSEFMAARYAAVGTLNKVTQHHRTKQISFDSSYFIENQFYYKKDQKSLWYTSYDPDRGEHLKALKEYLEDYLNFNNSICSDNPFMILEAVTALTPIIQAVYESGRRIEHEHIDFPSIKTLRRVTTTVSFFKKPMKIFGGTELRNKPLIVEKQGCENQLCSREKFQKPRSGDILYLKTAKITCAEELRFTTDALAQSKCWDTLPQETNKKELQEFEKSYESRDFYDSRISLGMGKLIPEPVKKEPEKQKKNSCCVVM